MNEAEKRKCEMIMIDCGNTSGLALHTSCMKKSMTDMLTWWNLLTSSSSEAGANMCNIDTLSWNVTVTNSYTDGLNHRHGCSRMSFTIKLPRKSNSKVQYNLSFTMLFFFNSLYIYIYIFIQVNPLSIKSWRGSLNQIQLPKMVIHVFFFKCQQHDRGTLKQ